MKWRFLFSPFHRWRNWGLERLITCTRLYSVVNGITETGTGSPHITYAKRSRMKESTKLICLFPSLCHFRVAKNLKAKYSQHALLKCQKGGGNHTFFPFSFLQQWPTIYACRGYAAHLSGRIERTIKRHLQLQKKEKSYMLKHRDGGNNRTPTTLQINFKK